MLRSRFAIAASATVLSLGCALNRPPPSARVDPTATGTAPGLKFDDSAIATVAAAISDGQDARARLAIRRGDAVRVRRFATELDADLPATKIATMSFGPRSSALSDEMAGSTDDALRDLDPRRGSDFDQEFVASEQRSLVTALRVLDETLIPRALNDELAKRLAQMRALLAAELRKANALGVALSAP